MIPKSTTNFLVALLSASLFFGLFLAFSFFGDGLSSLSLYLALALALLPLFLRDALYGRELFGDNALPLRRRRNTDYRRILIKIAGVAGSYAFVTFLYWLLPIYHENFFAPYWKHLGNILPIIAVISVPYIVYVDNRMKEPEDGYYHFGKTVLLMSSVDDRLVWEHLKCWIVKGFFLSLMSVYLLGNLNVLYRYDYDNLMFSVSIHDFATTFLFTVDLLFATIGYIFTLKLFNSQIYSTEPTLLGWLVCLMGYSPFWSQLFFGKYFHYEDNYQWGDLFWRNDALYFLWGSLIIACLTIYSLSTVAFGFRFSNLTYRGLISSGPYRYTKHPAYVFKNLSWWLISVPFFPNAGWDHAMRTSLLLFGVNVIYFVRARTEENHLSNYPEYVAYAEAMNDRSIFRWVGRLLPFMKYSQERALNSGSRVYRPFL